ncbi:hypothetical protein C1H46_024245 [Malus baccata]|uniref:Uncharacterized protein n=1 Tax=Malus baccata TaxID=106549 RepID=A0A540LUR6_MALBA|nr:hypothetical protein C1H46_024245 [Malus baccata]
MTTKSSPSFDTRFLALKVVAGPLSLQRNTASRATKAAFEFLASSLVEASSAGPNGLSSSMAGSAKKGTAISPLESEARAAHLAVEREALGFKGADLQSQGRPLTIRERGFGLQSSVLGP